MANEQIKHDKSFPPSASAGPDNAYYLKGCDVVQRSPAYASCLFKITEYQAGRRHEIYRDCSTAIEQRQCKAMGLRQEEELQGVALYYFPRKPPQELTLPAKTAGDFGVRVSNLTPPHMTPKDPKSVGRFMATVVPKKPVDALDRELDAASTGYAEAITAAVAELNAPQPAPQPLSRPPMEPGETPLQYARRLAAPR